MVTVFGDQIIQGGVFEQPYTFKDNVNLYFGTGRDFSIYHDGTNTYFDYDAGDLIILGNADVNDPSGDVYVTDAYGLANSDGSYTALNVGINAAQMLAMNGALGAPYGSFNCQVEAGIYSLGGQAHITGSRVNGSYNVPTALLTGQAMFAVGGFGWDGSVLGNGFQVRGKTIENWSAIARGTELELLVAAVGATALTTVLGLRVGRATVTGVLKTSGYTVATLPAGSIGDRAYVTDAAAPAFGAAVVGGGAVMVPVYYTGAAWFVG